jgi:hypothetical protein
MTLPLRRTPPQHRWAALLRGSFERAVAQRDAPEEAADECNGIDELIAKVMADIERHAASASATRSRAAVLCAEAAAALRATAIAEAASEPGGTARARKQGEAGRTLDVRR